MLTTFCLIWIIGGLIVAWVTRDALVEGQRDFGDDITDADITRYTILAGIGSILSLFFIIYVILTKGD